MNEVKKDILKRTYIAFFGILLFSLLVVFMLFNIQVVNGAKWKGNKYAQGSKYMEVEPVRGNIYAKNGELLATTMLYYDIRMDMKADGLSDNLWEQNVDSLSRYLAEFFADRTVYEYKNSLTKARKKGNRWYLIKRDVSYPQMRKIKKFPLFKLGRNKSGLICDQKIVRKKPFELLAQRTVGKIANREYGRNRASGLEGAYDFGLRGENGLQFVRKLPGGGWLPLDDRNTVEPIPGGDVHTTIDIELQDVAEDALYRYLVKYKAEHGCVILMETKTGAVRAIANLQVDTLGNAFESRNYAVWESAEPGSTFKLASLMAAFEDGYLTLEDKINTDKGIAKFYDLKIRDSKRGGYGVVSVKEAFTVSSNTAIAKLINRHYEDNPQKLINRFYQFGLTEKLDIEIPGEGKPFIKPVSEWSGVTLPQMSIGYEVQQTPLQMLTFYNAVANNGKMVKPRFVDRYYQNNKEYVIDSEVIKESICSKETLEKAKTMLESVIENGTAKNLKNDKYSVAGKTGTTQLNYWKGKENMSYKASFVGYFPADKPEYSCIVVVSTKSHKTYYGSAVAGPIFKEVADKVYAGAIDIQRPINRDSIRQKLPRNIVLHEFDAEGVQSFHALNEYKGDSDYLTVQGSQTKEKSLGDNMPDLRGMGLKDAIYILEGMGAQVEAIGSGKVVKQSVPVGRKLVKGSIVKIRLS